MMLNAKQMLTMPVSLLCTTLCSPCKTESVAPSFVAFPRPNYQRPEVHSRAKTLLHVGDRDNSDRKAEGDDYYESVAHSLSTSRQNEAPPASASASASQLLSLTLHRLRSSAEDDDDDGDADVVEPALLADFLMELGAASASVTEHCDLGDASNAGVDEYDSDRQGPIYRDVSAHFPSSFDMSGIVEAVRETFPLPEDLRYSVGEVQDRDWVLQVQKSWKPVVCAGFLLQLPWHTEDDAKEAIRRAGRDDIPSRERIRLQGGVAFGAGEHPTTRLCLSWVREVMMTSASRSDGVGRGARHFLDYGSGSGVLGLAACALVPGLRSVGIDVDAEAVRIANNNARMNDLPMRSYLPRLSRDRLDDESLSVALLGERRRQAMRRGEEAVDVETDEEVEVVPDHLDGRAMYEACVANVLAVPLIGLAPVLAGLVRPGAPIGLSGIMVGRQAEDILDAYDPFFDGCAVVKEEEGWVLITGRRRAEA